MTKKESKTQYGLTTWNVDVGDRLVKELFRRRDEIVTISRLTKTQAMYMDSIGCERKLRRETSHRRSDTPIFREVGDAGQSHHTRYRPEIEGDAIRIGSEKKLEAANRWFYSFKPSADQVLRLYAEYSQDSSTTM
jgi:hypothetical protein